MLCCWDGMKSWQGAPVATGGCRGPPTSCRPAAPNCCKAAARFEFHLELAIHFHHARQARPRHPRRSGQPRVPAERGHLRQVNRQAGGCVWRMQRCWRLSGRQRRTGRQRLQDACGGGNTLRRLLAACTPTSMPSPLQASRMVVPSSTSSALQGGWREHQIAPGASRQQQHQATLPARTCH